MIVIIIVVIIVIIVAYRLGLGSCGGLLVGSAQEEGLGGGHEGDEEQEGEEELHLDVVLLFWFLSLERCFLSDIQHWKGGRLNIAKSQVNLKIGLYICSRYNLTPP